MINRVGHLKQSQMINQGSFYTPEKFVRMAADWLKNKLILGRFDEDLYVYDAKTKKYMALDDLTGIEVDTYDTFEDLFSLTISEYLDYDDEEYLYDDEADAMPEDADGEDGDSDGAD